MKKMIKRNLYCLQMQIRDKLKENKGEGYVDTGIKILIAVVIGALLLAGLYLLFDGTILPTLKTKVIDMFNFRG